MAFTLKSIEAIGNGYHRVKFTPSNDSVMDIPNNKMDDFLRMLPSLNKSIPFEIQVKEVKSQEIRNGKILDPEYKVRFNNAQEWIPCKIPFEENL